MPRLNAPLRVVLPNHDWIDVRKSGTVKTSLPIEGSDDRVLLLFWGLSDEARFRNVVRVDRHGNVLWRAELPGDAAHDCFVRLEQRSDTMVAQTFSGQDLHLVLDGGAEQIVQARIAEAV